MGHREMFNRKGAGKGMSREYAKRDHRGIIYESLDKMLEAYGISKNTYYKRLSRGWSLEKTLTTPVRKRDDSAELRTGLNGTVYKSRRELAESNGITLDTYTGRLRKGWTKEDALSIKKTVPNKKACTDHLGNAYESIQEMCRSYGLKVTTYTSRLESGWSLEDALTKKVSAREYKRYIDCEDHLGNKYKSVTEMCRAYGINYCTYKKRINSGLSVKDALTKKAGRCNHEGKGST